MSSRSESYRLEGNKLLAQCENMAPVLKKGRLEKALEKYDLASRHAANHSEELSAWKNKANAILKIIALLESSSEKCEEDKRDVIRYHGLYCEFMSACLQKRDVKPAEWYEDLDEKLYKFIDDVFETKIPRILFPVEKMELAAKLCESVGKFSSKNVELLKSFVFAMTARFYCNNGISYLNEKIFKDALYMFAEANYPKEEGYKFLRMFQKQNIMNPTSSQLTRVQFLTSELNVIDNDLLLHSAIAEAYLCISKADHLFHKCMYDEERLNMDAAWQVYDLYREAILQSREKDLEIEAIAFSRMARMWKKVFKFNSKAKDCYRNVISIGLSMMPRDITKTDWFKEAKEVLQADQLATAEREKEKKATERQKYAKLVAEDVKIINDSMYDGVGTLLNFLVMIYEKYPPEKGSRDVKLELKKQCQKALLHYHTDKQTLDPDDKEDKIKLYYIREEICKKLSSYYNNIKLECSK